MKVLCLLAILTIHATRAQYTGDIVQYWVDQSGFLANNSIVGGLQSPPSGWFEAVVQASVYVAALNSKYENLAFQQLAVTHAAHDSLTWVFHGTRNFANIDDRTRTILPSIGINDTQSEYWRAAEIGRAAALEVTNTRQNDRLNNFVNYRFGPRDPGVYQQTPGGLAAPDTPQARYLRSFGGIGDITRYRAPPPPSINSSAYESILLHVKAQGAVNSTVRTPYETETAFLWRESSPILWNRFAHNVIGNRYATNVLASAEFYLKVNYALANAAIAGWDTKYFYNTWRPVTAIRRTEIWLQSGNNVTNTTWTPLLNPTPNHQEYLSTHACFGAAAAAVIKAYNNHSDTISIYLSSNATSSGVGVITRQYTSIAHAVKENGDSRVFGGIHFQFSSDVGAQVGDAVGKATLAAFESGWSQF